MPRARGYRRRALALAFGTFAAVVAAEGLSRGLGYHGLADPRVFQYDAEIGWTLIPNRREWHSALDFGVWITTDADGLRAGARPADSPAHPMRPTVLVLGDSFAFGWGVRGDTFQCRDAMSAFRTCSIKRSTRKPSFTARTTALNRRP